MKKIIGSLTFLIIVVVAASAQSTLAEDQNPNYKQSQDRYMKLKDSVIAQANTTSQQTYKAYDWYQERMDKRNARRELRREIRLANAFNYSNYDYGYNGYSYPYTNYGYYNNWRLLPSIGYTTGNWHFWY